MLYNKKEHINEAFYLSKFCIDNESVLLNHPRDWREPQILTDSEVYKYRQKNLALYYNTYGNILEWKKNIDSAALILRKAAF